MEEPSTPSEAVSMRQRKHSSFGLDEALGQGLPETWTLEDFRHRVRGLLDTYLGSGEAEEAVRCFREFAQETSQFLDEVVCCLVRTALERTPQQQEMTCSLLHSLCREAVLDGHCLVRGFAKLVCTWEDLILDSGSKAAVALVMILLSCMKDGCVHRSFLTRLPEGLLLAVIKEGVASEALPELREVADNMKRFKQDLVKAKLLEPSTRSAADALSSRAESMAITLRRLSMADYHHEFVKRTLVASFDWPPAERANCLALLRQLREDDVLTAEDIQWGAIHLLGQLEDLTLDCPGTADLAAEHLRALVASRLLSPFFLRRCELLRVGGAAGLGVLEAAQKQGAGEKDEAVEERQKEEDDEKDDDEEAEDEEEEEEEEEEGGEEEKEKEESLEKEERVEGASSATPTPDPAPSTAAQPGGRLTGGISLRPGGLTGGPSLRPGGSLTGNVSLRPGSSLTGSLTGAGGTAGTSLRPGAGGGGPTGGPRPAAASNGYPANDKKTEKRKGDKGDKAAAAEEASTSWRDDAAKNKEKKQDRARRKDKKTSAEGAARDDGEDKAKRVKKLEASENSWAAQQRRRREESAAEQPSNEEITRRMKSILNKLTLEKFDELYKQLTDCGISTEEHVRILIAEVFEKATSQHHFIEMYTLLCTNLSEWFATNVKVGNFKRILLDTCQASFEANLKPPKELQDAKEGADSEELQEKRFKHKMRMLGNIQLVGQLLIKKMVASKVLIAIAEELLSGGSVSTLETLAAFLKITGSVYDDADFKLHKEFCKIFSKLQKLVKDKALPSRTRFLLQDVLDLRADGWIDRKQATQKLEGPKKLDEISAGA